VAAALQRHYQPVKMNYQTLGNVVPTCTPTCCRGTRRTRRPAVRCRFRKGSGQGFPRMCSAGMRLRCAR
jgi:hypothetical protein